MKLGLVGDVHAEDRHLAAALAFFGREKADRVLCAGDVVDGRGDVERTIALLEAGSVLTVRGNHDRWIVADRMRTVPEAHSITALSSSARAWLEGLSPTASLTTPMGELLLCHGIGDDDMMRFRPSDDEYALDSLDALHAIVAEGRFSLLVGGHTHERMVRVVGGLTVVNAGTLREGNDPCCALLDTAARAVTFYDFDSKSGLFEADRYDLGAARFPV